MPNLPSAASSIETVSGGHPGDAEQRANPPLDAISPVPLAPIIADLAMKQSLRRFCIVSQSRIDRSCDALIARSLGYHSGLPEKERAAIWAKVSAFRRSVERGGGEGHAEDENQSGHALSAFAGVVVKSAVARSTWDDLRKETEKEMRSLARTLPVWPWMDGIRGASDLFLAVLVGEAGDISSYATKERLWKRLGLAVINGERQQKKTGPAAHEHGYSPSRRAEVWAFSDPLFRAQWRGARDEAGNDPKKSGKPVAVPAHALGPYGQVYAARKAHVRAISDAGGYAARAEALVMASRRNGKAPDKHNLEGRLSPKHMDNDAKRIMSKFLVENLWRVWNGKAPIEPADIGRPRAEIDDADEIAGDGEAASGRS